MLSKHILYRTGFGTQGFDLDCNNEDALNIAKFLFRDLPGDDGVIERRRYDIISSGSRPMYSLWEGEKNLYFGDSRYQLAYILMNEVIYHCIRADNINIALHAGAVFKGGRCIILPGKSGKGKSTLTSWLLTQGYNYLTDELIFLGRDRTILPLVRPVNLKVDQSGVSGLLGISAMDECICEEKGSMIPHRLFNPDFSRVEPRLTDIIFPQYTAGSELDFTKISPAKSCLYLLQSHVNARNLHGHGVAELSEIIRNCRSYTLTYSRFSDLETIFDETSGLLQ